MHTVCRLQREQPVYRFKEKTLISLCTHETTQKTVFFIDNKNALTLNKTYATSFHKIMDRFMYLPQQRHVYLIMFT